jgi:hypothetical protein
MSKDLSREIIELRNITGSNKLKLKAAIKQLIENRVSQRIKIRSFTVSGTFKSTQMQENFIEILREQLLNLDKHTKATQANILVEVDNSDNFRVIIRENSPQNLANHEIQSLIGNAKKSQSLNRLIEIVNGEHQVRLEKNGNLITHLISGGIESLKFDSKKSLFSVRITGIEDFAMNFARATYAFGLIYIPGYYFLHIKWQLLVLLTAHAILANLISFKFRESKLLLFTLTFISLSLLPFLSLKIGSCEEIRYLPWLYNIILANAFIVTFTVKNLILRWTPLIVLTIESLFLPIYYPASCRNIFLGSLPAIPIIAAFAIAFILFKRKVVREDLKEISGVYENQESLIEIERGLELEYLKVLDSLEKFKALIDREESSDQTIERELNLEIQRIRSFLSASEQFESKFIRTIYAFVVAKYEKGELIRLSINGKNLFQYDEMLDANVEVEKWAKALGARSAEITILRSDDLLVNFAIPNLPKNQVKLITDQLNSGSKLITYSVNLA